MASRDAASRIRAILVGALLCVSLTASGCGAAAGGRKLIPVSIGYGAPSAVYAPIMVAYHEGLFQKYGLKVSKPKMLVPPADTAALISGEAQFVDVGPEVPLQDLAGAHLKYIASVLPYFPLVLYGPKSIHSVADLSGKSIAVTGLDTATAYAALTLLRHEHVQGAKLLAVHSVPAIVTALHNGEAQAGTLSAPIMFKAQALGLHPIVNMLTLRLATVMIGVAVNESWARSHKAAIGDFLKAYTEGLKDCLTNPKVTEAALAQFLKIKDPHTLDLTYKWARASWPAIPTVHKAGIEDLLSFAKTASGRAANPGTFYDNSYLQDLQKAGFFKQLYPHGQPSNVMQP